MNSIGKYGMNQNRDSISVWRIAMPTDIDREVYVKSCYLTGTVTITNDNGEYFHNVKCGRLALQYIDFPVDKESFGSEVLCVTIPYSGELRITDVYNSSSEFADQSENQFRLSKNNLKGGFAELRIDGSGKILLSVDSEDEADVSISITNKDKSGKLSVEVNGEITIVNDGKTTIQSSNEIQLEQYDAEADETTSINIVKDQIKAISKKIFLNDGDEPILLGNKTADFLTKLLDYLGKESAGPYPLLGNANYTALKKDLDSLKSKLSFLK